MKLDLMVQVVRGAPVGSGGGRQLAPIVLLLAWLAIPTSVWPQSDTRLLLATGTGVPEHAGFVFGSMSGLSMNSSDELVFLSTLHGPRNDINALIRSRGVSFSVVAFEGLLSPVQKAFYSSFSAPSLNDAGQIAFTGVLKKDREDQPASIVVRVDATGPTVVAREGDAAPRFPGAVFDEFSAPLVDSLGNVLFSARLKGAQPATGLFLWTPTGTQSINIPLEMKLPPGEILEPFFFSHDEALLARRGTSPDVVAGEFLRAIAAKNFQAINPAPAPNDVLDILPANPIEPPVNMLLVLMESGKAETVALAGDPSQPLRIKPLAIPPIKELGPIQAQASGPNGNTIFASTPADQPNDLAFFCYCDGQINRLTTPDELVAITTANPGRPILSLAGDGQHTIAFLVATNAASDTAIYVTTTP
jgi:hypothetical protein